MKTLMILPIFLSIILLSCTKSVVYSIEIENKTPYEINRLDCILDLETRKFELKPNATTGPFRLTWKTPEIDSPKYLALNVSVI
jgi:hypothetical protein